jgi:hypothetical protein
VMKLTSGNPLGSAKFSQFRLVQKGGSGHRRV